MTRKEALTDLLAKVEAGESDQAVLEASYGVAEMTGDIGRYVRIIDAFTGSLDAAKALHEAVLTGWWVTMYGREDGPQSCGVIVAKVVKSRPRMQNAAASSTFSRAWLIAILRALIAECEQEETA